MTNGDQTYNEDAVVTVELYHVREVLCAHSDDEHRHGQTRRFDERVHGLRYVCVCRACACVRACVWVRVQESMSLSVCARVHTREYLSHAVPYPCYP